MFHSRSHRSVATSAAFLLLPLFAACQGVDIDETDRDALFFDARVRKDLEAPASGAQPFLELGWSSARGETEVLDYAVDLATLGGGVDIPIGADGRISGFGGLAWQLNDFKTTPSDLHDHNAFGLMVGFEAGWRATAWLEPYARVDSALFLDQFATTTRYEGGLRFHAHKHAALFVGWRQLKLDIDEVQSDLEVTSLKLDASGLVFGFELAL